MNTSLFVINNLIAVHNDNSDVNFEYKCNFQSSLFILALLKCGFKIMDHKISQIHVLLMLCYYNCVLVTIPSQKKNKFYKQLTAEFNFSFRSLQPLSASL